jgi:tetratricopeptide (TPR) repeat protein
VKAAFYRATRRYSPESLSTYESDEAKALAGEIYMMLRDAYRKLSDAAAREHTRKLLRRSGLRAHVIPTATMPEATPPPEPISNDTEPLMVIPTLVDVTMPEGGDPRDTHPGGGLSHSSLFGDLTFEHEMPPPADPHPTLPGVDQANSLLDSGQFEDALALVEEVLKQQPRDREARAAREMALGFRCLKNGDRLAAARHFEAALQMIPANEPAARALDVTRRSQGQSGKAILDRILGKK